MGIASEILGWLKRLVDDIELKVLQCTLYKLQGHEAKYEKLVRRLIEHCIEKGDSIYDW